MQQLRQTLLFSDNNLRLLFDSQKEKVKNEFGNMDTNYILNVTEEQLHCYFSDKYRLEVPSLLVDSISLECNENKIDVSKDQSRFIRDRSRPFLIDGFKITISIPYVGEKELFYFQTSSYTLSPPTADITQRDLQLCYVGENVDDDVKQRADKTIDEIQKYLTIMKADVEGFNTELDSYIKGSVVKRKERYIQAHKVASNLGFPLKERNDNLTYVAPAIRRKVKIEKPTPIVGGTALEPVLSDEDYLHILNVIQNMVLVMERSPKAFSTMGEEDLRQHFLVQLNGHYEGQATGETFNFIGKTDILIRVDGRNIFIAECKFWHGEDQLIKTIDQLLGYLSWRDTKTALLIFNRNKKFTDVVAKAIETTSSHAMYVKSLGELNETTFQFVFQQPQEPDKQLLLALAIFNVPSK
jgi:hypothetical protein